MFRIDNATAITPIPAPAAVGPNPNYFFTKGNPGLGIPATIVDDDWANAIQEEICGVVEGIGIVLSKTNRAQLLAAIKLAIILNPSGVQQDSGAANAMVITPNPAVPAYANGLTINVIPANNNTSASPTLNVNGLGAKTIVGADGGTLAPGDIIAGGLHQFTYVSGLNKFVLQSTRNNIGSLATPGYLRIPGTKLLLQWTSYSFTPATTTNCPTGSVWGSATVTWPLAFPSSGLAAWPAAKVSNNGQYVFASTAALTTTGVDVYQNSWNTATFPTTGVVFGIGI